MTYTAQGIITDAMSLFGAVAIDETPTTSELNLGLRVANAMIDRWASRRLLLRATVSVTVPLTTNKAAYTVGASGADVIFVKPAKLISGYLRDSGNNDVPLEVIDKSIYDTFGDKAVSTGKPEYVAYDPGLAQQAAQKGTFYFYYTPSTNYTAYLDVDAYLTEFANLSDNVSFEPAYYEALIYNLAVRLFRHYREASIPIPADIQLIANNTLSDLRSLNSVPFIAGMEFPGKVSKYNIYTDGDN